MDNKKLNIYLFYAIALLQGMVFYGPIATLYRQAHGLSVFDITLIESISLIVMLAFEVPWGYAADRIGYKKTIIICNVLFFISKVVFWKAESFMAFLGERLILSVVLSGLSGCDSAYLYISAGEKDSQRVFGIYQTMGTLGLVFSSVIFSVAVKNHYELSALLTVISYSMAMILSLFLTEVKPKEREHRQFNKQFRVIVDAFMQNKRFIMFLVAASLMAESNQTITVFLNQLLYLNAGILPEYMGYIYILVTIAGMASVYSYKFMERVGEYTATRLLFLTAGIACVAMTLYSNPVIAVSGIVILRICASIFAPISMDIQNRQINISDRATMLSIYSIIMNMLAVGTNLIFGRLADISFKYAIAAGTVFCFIGLFTYVLWKLDDRLNERYID